MKRTLYLLNDAYQEEGVISLPLLKTEFLSPSLSFDQINALLFTSKNGVIALDKLSSEWKKLPSFCIGDTTAKKVKSLGGEVAFISQKSYSHDLAEKILSHQYPYRFLFSRAEVIASSIGEKIRDAKIFIDEVITYRTVCNNVKTELDENAIIIFTSPSSVACFLKQFEWRESYCAVVIGETTKKAFPYRAFVSCTPNIESCVVKAKEMSD